MEKEQNIVAVEADTETVLTEEKQPAEKKQDKKTRIFTRQRTRFIAFTALFAAIAVVVKMFTVPFGVGGSLKLTFTYVPAFLAGALFGPFSGFLVGVIADVLGFFIGGQKGIPNPIITVTSGLLGLLPGVIFWIFKRFRGENFNLIVPTVLSFLSVLLICTNLNTVANYIYNFGFAKDRFNTFWAYAVYRTPGQAVVWAVNLIIGVIVITPVDNLARRILK